MWLGLNECYRLYSFSTACIMLECHGLSYRALYSGCTMICMPAVIMPLDVVMPVKFYCRLKDPFMISKALRVQVLLRGLPVLYPFSSMTQPSSCSSLRNFRDLISCSKSSLVLTNLRATGTLALVSCENQFLREKVHTALASSSGRHYCQKEQRQCLSLPHQALCCKVWPHLRSFAK